MRIFSFIKTLFAFAFIAAFCFFASAQNLESLADQIKNADTETKRDALAAIRNLETAEASRIAVRALSDNSEVVRATAAYSVIFLPTDEAVNALLPNLNDKSPLVRRETAYALGEVGDTAATNRLLQVLKKDKISEVRNAAAVALGKIGDAAAISELLEILRKTPAEKDEFLRRSAARSIGQIAERLQNEDVRTEEKIETNTPENLIPETPVVEILKNKNLSETFSVFRSVVSVLISNLQNPREFDDVKRETAFALGAIGDDSAVTVLQSNLNAEDYYLAQISREALAKMGAEK